jgi:hypothetical protein
LTIQVDSHTEGGESVFNLNNPPSDDRAMDPMNDDPTLRPLPPRVRIFQSLLVLAVFALVPLWPAQAQALCG